MGEFWGAIAGISGALTVLTLFFLYIVRAEISKAISEQMAYLAENFVSKELFLESLRSMRATSCPLVRHDPKHGSD